MANPFDPSGINLQRQGLDTFLAFKDAERRQDYGPGGSAIDQAVHMTGPLPDPKWQAFFQALQNQGVSRIAERPNLATGRARNTEAIQTSPGSNQLTGVSAQPDYFTGGDTFMGRTTAPYDYGDETPYAGRVGPIEHPHVGALGNSVAVLKNRARPVSNDHTTFLQGMMGNDPAGQTAPGLAPPTAPAKAPAASTPKPVVQTQPLAPPPLSTAIQNYQATPLGDSYDAFVRKLYTNDPTTLAAALGGK